MKSGDTDLLGCLTAALRNKSRHSLRSDLDRSRAELSVPRLPRGGAALLALMMVLSMLGSSPAFAQAQSTGQPHESLSKLAEEFIDPLTTLPQVFFRDD